MSHNLQTTHAEDFALRDHRVLAIQGRDAVAFVQAQFMNDVALLGDGQWQWNGWLTPKGRVVAIFALLRRQADLLWLLLPDNDPGTLASQLRRYVFRSNVAFHVRDDLVVSGAFSSPVHASGANLAGTDEAVELDASAEAGPRRLRVGTTHAPSVEGAASRWRMCDLQHGMPRLDADQLEQWTPQQLSLDRLKAYSLKKGCYPGQEIVARTHFLGQAKRGLVRLQGDGVVEPGEVIEGNTQRALGRVICAEENEGLAVLPQDAGDGPFHAGGTRCVRLPLLGGLAR